MDISVYSKAEDFSLRGDFDSIEAAVSDFLGKDHVVCTSEMYRLVEEHGLFISFAPNEKLWMAGMGIDK